MLTKLMPMVDSVQNFDPPVEHFTQGSLPQSERETKECDITDTAVTASGALAPSTAIPPTMSTSVLTNIPLANFSWISVRALHVHCPWLFLIKDIQFCHLIFYYSSLDILADAAYEDLLRVAASGQVGYGSASPSCCEYSRLKLQEDGGPKALRSPEHLSGMPNLTAWELQRVQESFMMLARCVEVLTLVFQSGGHVHLEQ